jgi:single-strand DNA-binding protein
MLNKVVLMGRLVADPELRHTQNNIAVTSFRLAVDRRFARQGEQRQADFIDIVAWRGTAEFVCNYFRKGLLVAVSGSLRTRSYEDKQGNRRTAYEVVADEVYFAEPKRDTDRSGRSYDDEGSRYGAPADESPDFPVPGTSEFEEIDMDEELPF